MRRAWWTVCLVLSLAAPAAAQAGEVSGRLVYCTGGDYCRYFTEARLDVGFEAAPGESNELRMLPQTDGMRLVDAGATLVAGPFCTAVTITTPAAGLPLPCIRRRR
jgi:hypothetical protein